MGSHAFVFPLAAALWIAALAYVVRDARRRNQSGLLWGLVALLIPSGLGFVLWFIVRRRLPIHPLEPTSAVVRSGG